MRQAQTQRGIDVRDPAPGPPPGPLIDLRAAIEAFIAAAPNNTLLKARLKTLDGPIDPPRFLHRFLMFNDALAARVPYLAGLIHLTPDLFLDPGAAPGFLAQANGRVAAYVAQAAADEYRIANGHNGVHQHLSQVFFRAALRHGWPDTALGFEHAHPIPPEIAALLTEARAANANSWSIAAANSRLSRSRG